MWRSKVCFCGSEKQLQFRVRSLFFLLKNWIRILKSWSHMCVSFVSLGFLGIASPLFLFGLLGWFASVAFFVLLASLFPTAFLVSLASLFPLASLVTKYIIVCNHITHQQPVLSMLVSRSSGLSKKNSSSCLSKAFKLRLQAFKLPLKSFKGQNKAFKRPLNGLQRPSSQGL